MLLWWALGVDGPLLEPGDQRRGPLRRPRPSSTGPRRAWSRNAALIAMAGPARALNTVGGQVTWQATAFGAIVAGLMSMFLVGRHTRAEEESGRDELLRAAAVGRARAD